MCGLSSHGEEQVASGAVKEMEDGGEGGAGESTSAAEEAHTDRAGRHLAYESCTTKGHVRETASMPARHQCPSTRLHFAIPSAAA